MLSEIYLLGVTIQTYWLTMLLGFAAMLWVTVHRKKIYRFSNLGAVAFTVLVMVFGLIGCKLLYIAENFSTVLKNGVTAGGFSFFGAVFLIPVMMGLLRKPFSLNWRQCIDACTPCVIVMIAVMRFGCLLNGCCGGWVAQLGKISFQWPTQAFEGIGDVAILIWILNIEKSGDKPGALYPCFLLSYGVLRFFVEFFRDTAKDWLYMSHGQWFSIVAILIAVTVLKRKKITDGGTESNDKKRLEK